MPLPHRSTPISTLHQNCVLHQVQPSPHEHTAPFPISHPPFPHFSFFPVSKVIAPKHRQGRLRDAMRGSAAQHSQQPGTSAPNSLL